MATTTASAKRGRNEPPPQPIIVKKIINEAHAGHHGGAWKIAYADFVTAMMAFFLLMWLVGATNEQQRQGLADYFTPTLVEFRQASAGSNGILGGDSIVARENYPHRQSQNGARGLITPRDATAGEEQGTRRAAEEAQRFQQLRQDIQQRIATDPALRQLQGHVSFTQTAEGLRIDLVDDANFSMFELGTNQLRPEALRLVQQVAQAIGPQPNQMTIRGHTDGRPYGANGGMNNWMLSTARAEATRAILQRAGVGGGRFERIEGVADREPFVPSDRMDARNRRISISLLPAASAEAAPAAGASGGAVAPARHPNLSGARSGGPPLSMRSVPARAAPPPASPTAGAGGHH